MITFGGCQIGTVGSGYELHATDGSLTAATSAAFNVTAGTASKLVFSIEPPSSTATGSAFTSVVSEEDTNSNVISSDSATTVTLSIAANPAAGTLTCTNPGGATATVSSGVASFTCSINKAGSGYTLAAASGSLTSALSTSFTITGTSTLPPPAPAPTTTTTATTTTSPTTLTATTSVGVAGSLSVGAGSSAVTVGWSAGSFSGTSTVTATEAPQVGGGATFAAGTMAVQVSVHSSSGGAVTSFAEPLDLQFPNAPAGIVPGYSVDGLTWFEIPQLSGTTLPAGFPDGWYRDAAGTLHILTLHATYFGLLTSSSRVTAALKLATGLRDTLNLNRTHRFVLHLQSTLPAHVMITLRHGKHTLGSWRISLLTTAKMTTITLPKAARHSGADSVVLVATAGKDTIKITLPLALVTRD